MLTAHKSSFFKAVVPELFKPRAGCRFFGPPRAKAREKKVFSLIPSPNSLLFPKIVVISKKKRSSPTFPLRACLVCAE